jgi:hypothetical protein
VSKAVVEMMRIGALCGGFMVYRKLADLSVVLELSSDDDGSLVMDTRRFQFGVEARSMNN